MLNNRIQLVLVLAVIGLVGVVIGQALPRPVAEAQQGPRQWRECFAASLWDHDGSRIGQAEYRPRSIPVRPGWVPIGAAGNDAHFSVVLCR